MRRNDGNKKCRRVSDAIRAQRYALRNLNHAYDGRLPWRAVEFGFRFGRELYRSVFLGEKRVVAGLEDVHALEVFCAALAEDDLADHDFLAVVNFDAEPFCNGIAP